MEESNCTGELGELFTEGGTTTVKQLLQQMEGGGPKQLEALTQLVKIAQGNEQEDLDENAAEAAATLLPLLMGSETSTRQLALEIILEILANKGEVFVPHIGELLPDLITCMGDTEIGLCVAAEECMDVALTELPPTDCLLVVQNLVNNAKNDGQLATALSCLKQVVSRIQVDTLTAGLPTILPGLFAAFGSQNADVRKNVVMSLVEIYMVLGDAFVPHLSALSAAQLRLVTIYANRLSKGQLGLDDAK